MKVPKAVLNMLENKYVLYFVLFLAVSNILGFLMMGNITAIIFFSLVAYLTSFFSKNKIVILSIPLVLTSVLMVGARVKEGLENAIDSVKKPVAAAAATAVAKATDTAKKVAKNATDTAKNVVNVAPAVAPIIGTEPEPEPESESASEPVPASASKADGMTTMYGKKNNRIDYASTIEDAYDDLNKIIGGDGIKRLTDDTQKLMGQQMQLADAMKSMSPLLEQAKTMLQGFDLKNLDGLAQMAKQFTAPGGATGLQMPKM